MRSPFLALVLLAAPAVHPQTPIEIQPVVELRPTGSLSTCSYKPTAAEAPYFEKLVPKEHVNDAIFGGKYTIHGKTGVSIGWFAVVRGITPPVQPGGETTLLLQHQFFDGETDCHIMLVAKTGDGDFLARLRVPPDSIPALSLVRVYGKVTGEKDHTPAVAVDYLRVWPWMTFTFTDLAGTDHSNPRWRRAAQVKPSDSIYVPYPTEAYYRKILGDPSQFGINLKPE